MTSGTGTLATVVVGKLYSREIIAFDDTMCVCVCVCVWCNSPQWAKASPFPTFLDQTRRIKVSRTPLDERSARRRDLYLTTHNTHNRQTSEPPVGFELTISAGERPQTHVLDRAATGTGYNICYCAKNYKEGVIIAQLGARQ
jgi:hypothetical protein